MRLTNVALVDLVGGRVSSYAVQAGSGPGRELPISFDQRAHGGGGQRPGSWMAIAFRLQLPGGVQRDELARAWDAVVARHGTLRAVFSHAADGKLALHEVDVLPGVWEEHDVGPGRLVREVVREVFDANCGPFSRPSHRLVLIEPGPSADDARPEVLIGSDHTHVDMWSLVLLARDLLACLDDLRAEQPVGADLPPAPSFAEHTAALEAMPPAPADVRERWARVLEAGDGAMPVFPLPLGELRPSPAEVVEVRDVLDAAGTERLAATAREQGVRLIALGLSALTGVTAELSGKPLRAVFPVHSRHEPRWRDAVGWFITNAVLECTDPDPAACVRAVEAATGLGSWPLAPIFADSGGVMPTPPGMFAVSWLDARRLPVPTAQAADPRYVSAAIRTDGVMIWFVVNDAGLHLRCRYPDTPEARENVGRWLDGVEADLRERAAAVAAP